MKLASTSEKEIMSLFHVLNEIESVTKYNEDVLELDNEDFPILSKFDNSNYEYFLNDLMSYLSGIHFQRILWNCITMLNNCTDLTKDTLEFHPDIEKGLELLKESQKKN